MSEEARALFELVRTGGGAHSGPALQAVGSDDPDVVERWVSVDEDAPRQVVTAYGALAREPDSYPAELPFVAGVRTFVTVMGEGAPKVGARWLVEDQADVVAEVLSALLVGGWVEEAGRELGFPFPGRRIVLRRGDDFRLLLEARLDRTRRIVQLLPLV